LLLRARACLLTPLSPFPAPPRQVLGEQLSEARAQAAGWEAQAQDGLSTIARLQDCLEEGAAWEGGGASGGGGGEDEGGGAGGGGDAGGGGGDEAGSVGGGAVARLRSGVARREAKAAAADLRARALAAELLRAHAARGAAGRALVPLLSGVEARLRAARDAARGER
jgi:hypothetical protein